MICVRGATTTEKNERNDILQATKEMLECIIVKNELELCDIIQIQFTMTKDLDAVYPAVAAREIGITEAALMCTQELYVVGSLKKCIRCAVLCDVNKKTKTGKSYIFTKCKGIKTRFDK